MSDVKIDRNLAKRVLEIVDQGLVYGLGTPEPGMMCVEAAVCYAMGLPHGDEPICVSPALRALKIRLNDKNWSSPAARAAGMRRLAIAQLGTAGVLDDGEFAKRVAEMTIRKVVPRALRSAILHCKDPAQASAMEAAALACEREGTRATALGAKSAAADVDAAYTAYTAYAAYAAAAAAAAAADAVDADDAVDACAAATDAAAARDRELTYFAEEIVQILIKMVVPAVAWLDLAGPPVLE